jgi:hypothetical protein
MKETILRFLEWIKKQEMNIIHIPTLTSPTEKGMDYLIDDFLNYEKEHRDE